MTARSSLLRSATVVVGAAHSARMSPARARIVASSAAVSRAERRYWYCSYSSPSRARSASASSQSRSSWRATSRFSGSAS
jgi:hypothetical protein